VKASGATLRFLLRRNAVAICNLMPFHSYGKVGIDHDTLTAQHDDATSNRVHFEQHFHRRQFGAVEGYGHADYTRQRFDQAYEAILHLMSTAEKRQKHCSPSTTFRSRGRVFKVAICDLKRVAGDDKKPSYCLHGIQRRRLRSGRHC
jgi:hypothetical protein